MTRCPGARDRTTTRAWHVRLDLFDFSGRRVATLVDGVEAAGRYEVSFDGSGLSDGVYLYRMASGTFVETRRFVFRASQGAVSPSPLV